MLPKSSSSQSQSQSQSQSGWWSGRAAAWHRSSSPLTFPLLSLLLLMPMLLLGDEAAVDVDDVGVAFTWGYVNKYASTIHDQEVLLAAVHNDTNVNNDDGNGTATVLIRYPAEGAEQNSYTITAMHAYDSTEYNDDANGNVDADAHFAVGADVDVDTTPPVAACLKCVTIELLSGGVGYKYAVLRFHRAQDAYRGDIHYKLVIYGLEL